MNYVTRREPGQNTRLFLVLERKHKIMFLFLGSRRYLGFSWGFASPVPGQTDPALPRQERGRAVEAPAAAAVGMLCAQPAGRDCPLVSVTILSLAWLSIPVSICQ